MRDRKWERWKEGGKDGRKEGEGQGNGGMTKREREWKEREKGGERENRDKKWTRKLERLKGRGKEREKG